MKAMRIGLGTLVLLALGATGAQAQRFGVQASWGDDTDFGIGGRIEFDLAGLLATEGPLARTFGIGSFDYFFPDCDDGFDNVDCTYWELNANLAVPLVATGIDPYVGAGLNLANWSVDVDGAGFDGPDGTELGVNLLGGLRFMLGGLSAFGEGRLELSGGEQLVLTFGVLLGGAN